MVSMGRGICSGGEYWTRTYTVESFEHKYGSVHHSTGPTQYYRELYLDGIANSTEPTACFHLV
jgi:hypothetical protein